MLVFVVITLLFVL